MTVYEISVSYGSRCSHECGLCDDEFVTLTSQIDTKDLPGQPDGAAGRCAAIGWAIDGAEQAHEDKGPFTVESVEVVEDEDVWDAVLEEI